MAKHDAEANFAEIRAVLCELPGPDLDSGTAAAERDRSLAKPAGGLGRLEEIAAWLAAWQGRHPPRLERPRTAVFAGNHGVAARGVSASRADLTRRMVAAFIDGGGAVNQLCAQVDADLRVYEMALDEPTADFTAAPAMSEAECARAMAYGMMAVEEGFDVMALGGLGVANTTSAAALSCALFGGAAADWVDADGLDAAGLRHKEEAVAAGLERHREALDDPLEVLRRLGGLELAAVAGAVIACRLARTPVLLDGFACTAAAAVLYRIDAHALDHCMVGHLSAERGHRRLLEAIGKRPLLDLGLRLGEGSGATLAVPLLRAACACHTGMATSAEAGT